MKVSLCNRMSKVVTRPYNTILINGDKVIKRGPLAKIKKELSWMSAAKRYIPNNIPHMYTSADDYYRMERIKGCNLYQLLRYSSANLDTVKILKNLFSIIRNKLHRKTLRPKKEDITLMYYLKPNIALKHFLKNRSINQNKIIINGKKMKNPLRLLRTYYLTLEKDLWKTTYSFIHGDLTFSNILIDKDKKFYFIDPRGQFGNTELYGDVRYDVAKLYYSIIGEFDSLNAGEFEYSFNKWGYNYLINGLQHPNFAQLLLSKFNENEDIIKFIHCTIWLSLISHINNKRQKYAAFCHGVYLINELKNEKYNK